MYTEPNRMENERHSGSLFNQKYFEGFRRAVTMRENGEMRVEFVYEGIYYTRETLEPVWHKMLHAVLPAVCLAGLIWAMSVRTPMNHSRWVLFFQVLLMFLLGLDLICGVVRLMAKKKLTRWEYRMTVLSVKEIAMVSAIDALGLSVAALVRTAQGLDLPDVLLPGLIVYPAVALLMIGQFLMVRAEKYQESESRDILQGIDVTNELSPMESPDEYYWS